ncbi:MAG: hypothetical protein V7629_13085 [Motiliproteus sp.]
MNHRITAAEFDDAGLSSNNNGMKELARQLTLTLTNPVWQQVRTPAPWAISDTSDTSDTSDNREA